jgi:hypothetical protein
MKKELKFEALAIQYGLSIEFVKELHGKVVDKENFERALRMFKDGTLKYETATGKDPINISEIRKEVAGNFQAMRERVRAQMEKQQKISDYYNTCKVLYYPNRRNPQEAVFIKDGHVVAFAHFEPKQGGIYAANNEVMPNFNWTPHDCLGRLRKMNKAFYREVKRAAFADDKELFDFNIQPNGDTKDTTKKRY